MTAQKMKLSESFNKIRGMMVEKEGGPDEGSQIRITALLLMFSVFVSSPLRGTGNK